MSEIPKRFWNEYQKEIADDHYFYERSCIRQTFFPGSEAAFLKIMREELGKDIVVFTDVSTYGLGQDVYAGDFFDFNGYSGRKAGSISNA